MTKQEIIKMFNLKKEDILLLDQYIFQLKKTNNFFNLVGRSTLTNPWERHICDSLQLSEFIKNKKSRILDMGSGAGIPGIPLSIIGYENLVMVEAKNKKANFIKEVIFSLKLKAKVINTRLEELHKKPTEFIVCRALAPLVKLINYSLLFADKNTTLVFLKGKSANKELVEAKEEFKFEYKLFKSKTNKEGLVVKITNFKKK